MRLRLVVLLVSIGLSTVTGRAGAAPLLARRGLLGARVGELTAAARSRLGYGGNGGVLVLEVLPDTAAARAGVRADDIILGVENTRIARVPQFLRAIGNHRAGQDVQVELWRAGKVVAFTARLESLPLERSSRFEIVYGSVEVGAARLRTIVTRPRGAGRHPALLLIQGLGCESIDFPLRDTSHGRGGGYKQLVDTLTERGVVAMRVEKSGTGDSTGKPCSETSLTEEASGFAAALRVVRSFPFVDPDRLFVFGHSMGGVIAPIIARRNQVRGVIVFGTVFRTWLEYELENRRRQARLQGLASAAVDEHLRRAGRFFASLCGEKLSPRAIIERAPELRELADDGEHVYGRSYRFFVELGATNLAARWREVTAKVLAIWGTADYVSSRTDHELLVETVNRERPGTATLLELDQIDHGFHRARSMTRSFRRRYEQPFHDGLVPRLVRWMSAVARPR